MTTSTKNDEAIRKALLVVVTTQETRDWLVEHDPKALQQAEAALKGAPITERDARLGPQNEAPETGLRLLVDVRALRSCDLEDGLSWVLRSVEAGNTSGHDGCDDKSFSFSISGSDDEAS